MAEPPAHVTFSAAVVQSWLDKQQPGGQSKVTDEQFKRMSHAERLDYTRKFDQSQFQNNKDNRHGSAGK
jgi:hypothetical protein